MLVVRTQWSGGNLYGHRAPAPIAVPEGVADQLGYDDQRVGQEGQSVPMPATRAPVGQLPCGQLAYVPISAGQASTTAARRRRSRPCQGQQKSSTPVRPSASSR